MCPCQTRHVNGAYADQIRGHIKGLQSCNVWTREEDIKKCKVLLVEQDLSAAEGDKAKESIPHDKKILFKAKVWWDEHGQSVISHSNPYLVTSIHLRTPPANSTKLLTPPKKLP
ncbi:hypothetical protein EV363DRAFT_1451783 [Boletus edulis]|nr:hypothetical protein EV363DRAFT_1451783 [Boletus edulis]